MGRLEGRELLEVVGYTIALGFVVLAGAELADRLRKRVAARLPS